MPDVSPARSAAGRQDHRAAPLDGRRLTGLLAAEVVSTTGTEMTAIALPWFVLVSTGSPTRMGAVLTAEFVGMSVLGLWAGGSRRCSGRAE